MRQWWLAAIFLPLAVLAAKPRIGVVYSDWPDGKKSFFKEFDKTLAELAWVPEKIENTALPELSQRLADFDLIIASSVANYTHTVDMAPYANQWLDYLNQGGMLLVVDANYASVLNAWVAKFGPDFAATTENCSAYKLKTPESRVVTVHNHPFLQMPYDLAAALTVKNHWAHMTRLSDSWERLITCSDDEGLLLLKSVGKGLVVLCSYAQMGSADGKEAGIALLQNMFFWRQFQQHGLRILALAKGTDQVGPSAFNLRLQGAPESLNGLVVELTETAQGQAPRQHSATAAVTGDQATLNLALPAKTRGQTAWRLALRRGNDSPATAEWQENLPPVIAIALKRKHLYPRNRELEANFTLVPLQAELTGAELRWRLDDQPVTIQPLSSHKFQQTIAVTGLPEGRHVLKAEFWARGTCQGQAEAEFFTHPQPLYDVRADGVLLEAGKPFFPLGFYHVSWKFTPAQRLDMAKAVAAAGYNTIHVGFNGDERNTNSYGDFLDACAANNLRVITEFGYSPKEVITKYRGYSAVMGWNPGDEPAARGITAEEMFRRYDQFKQLDPNHLAYTVICIPAQYGRYACGTDVLAPDPYPIPKHNVDDVFRRFQEARQEALKVDTTVWAVLQCFGGYGSWSRPPTPQEFRAMTYLALLAQVKGIIYYTYADGGFYLPDSTELHQAVQALPAELKDLLPMVMDGHFELHANDVDRVYIGSWNMNGQRRIVIVNADKEKTVPFAYEAREPGLPTVLYGEAIGMRREDATIRAEIKPLERIVLLE